MSEYIDREAAIEICEAEYQARLRMCDYCGDTVAWNIGSEIKALPAADVAPVVRCKDCLFWKSGKNECESWEWCTMLNRDMPPHAFCNLGERKDDDDAKES